MNTRIYLDNAATTSLDPLVFDAMMPFFTEKFGNPSSIYSYGRETKLAIEQARKTVAKCINAKPSEIFFTSGGTESSNTAINGAIHDLGCKHIISSKIEHHATLHTIEYLEKQGKITLEFVNLLDNGQIDLNHLEQLLSNATSKTLVTLMHGNNEIGNILPIEKVGELCEKYTAILHSDTVQTLSNLPLDVHQMKVHFLNGAGHKFHGPKGVGMMFIKEGFIIQPIIKGGGQERNMRAGTENVYGIVGFAKALELAMEERENKQYYLQELKTYFWQQLQQNIEGVVYNGDIENSLPKIINIGFSPNAKSEMLLYSLDIAGVCVSGGSACASGTNMASHVIASLKNRQTVIPIRFSFSKHTTKNELDIVLKKIIDLNRK